LIVIKYQFNRISLTMEIIHSMFIAGCSSTSLFHSIILRLNITVIDLTLVR